MQTATLNKQIDIIYSFRLSFMRSSGNMNPLIPTVVIPISTKPQPTISRFVNTLFSINFDRIADDMIIPLVTILLTDGGRKLRDI